MDTAPKPTSELEIMTPACTMSPLRTSISSLWLTTLRYTFLLKLRDTTMAAIEESRFAQVVGRLQESMEVPITGKVQDVVQLTSQSYGINAEEQEGILKYLIEGGDLSLYGLSNAVTRASQDVVSYDRATALEGIGWQVATMEPAQWKEINR